MGGPNLRAVALIAGDKNIRGCLQFTQDTSGTTHVTGKISGLSPGFHGFHIHSFGDTTNGCNSTGPHFNPLNRVHGPPDEEERHAGDLGNIFAGSDGIRFFPQSIYLFCAFLKNDVVFFWGEPCLFQVLLKSQSKTNRYHLVGSIPYLGGRLLYMVILMTLAEEDTSLANQQETQAHELDAILILNQVLSDFKQLWILNYSFGYQ
ncbi:superoxide dismutase [Cu-Zn]-like isoform X1 [Brassica napus]|uniref:superoxide dismutase [Cu-Zn]-like isoform X1 n=1 Tax=Brassica napus TaxID=3708 RepID=UPI0020787FA5|nr:superoxide dismutase [Cu-Zn]-like isoform X1 [Brassica napus]